MAKSAVLDHGRNDAAAFRSDALPLTDHRFSVNRQPHLSLLAPVHHKENLPLTPQEQRVLKERFFRDSEISSQLSAIMMNLTPEVMRSLEVMIQARKNGRSHNRENLDLFCEDSREIFSTLDQLGVKIFALPEGRASFRECTASDFFSMYTILYYHRVDFQQGLYPMQGATPLSVRPRQSWNEPHWKIDQFNRLQDFVTHELPDYNPNTQAYAALSKPFHNIIMRVLDDHKHEYQPNPQEAQEFLYYLRREILPGFRRAVIHYTAWHSMNLYGPMTLPDQDQKTLPLLRILYATHDKAVAIIADLDVLTRRSILQLPKKTFLSRLFLEASGEARNEQPLLRAMDEIRAKLEQFHVLDIV